VCGGYDNAASSNNATVSGGYLNTASAAGAVVGGGEQNTASGPDATVAGGHLNVASGQDSFAAGDEAKAAQQGVFVWADSQPYNFDPYGQAGPQGYANSFNVRSTGGFYIVTAVDGSGKITADAFLSPGSTSWSTLSDRNAKKDFAPVNTEAVLDKLATVPVEQWHYKWEADNSTPNIGPMAQDFIHAFYPGRDDKSITTLEFDGVELAAIQGLNEKLNQKLEQKQTEITKLREELDQLKQVVNSLNAKMNGGGR
jgi:trimeric autotransporter adhesin